MKRITCSTDVPEASYPTHISDTYISYSYSTVVAQTLDRGLMLLDAVFCNGLRVLWDTNSFPAATLIIKEKQLYTLYTLTVKTIVPRRKYNTNS